MTVYEHVLKLLQENEKYRNSDKELQWRVYMDEGVVVNGVIEHSRWMDASSTESIRRARQKVQEDHPELQASKPVQEFREKKQETKSTFVYREQTTPKVDLSIYFKGMTNKPDPVINDQLSLI